jgi:hypothetical protein
MNKIEVAVYIPDEDASKWILFQQYYDPFTVMVNHGVFGVKNGSVALHFDHEGVLRAINRADILYSRKYENTGVHN